MGSDRRQRPHILTVRLHDHEESYLQAAVAGFLPARVTRADVARHILFDVPLIGRPSCGDAHGAHCTAHHHNLVTGYRLERHQQETDLEPVLTNPAERQLWRENGGKIISFADWLEHNTAQEPQQP